MPGKKELMKANIFSRPKQGELTPKTPKSSRQRMFSSVRFRILAWYFLLTACTVLVSIAVTRQIFCNLLQRQAQEALISEVGKFNRLVEQVDDQSTLEATVEEILPLHVPARNEYIFALIDGQIFSSSQLPLPDAISPKGMREANVQNSSLLEEWANVSNLTHSELIISDGPIYSVANPIEIGGAKGVVVAVRDARVDYQTGTQTIILVIKVATVVLTVFFAIAWVTAGRVLLPLRRVTDTARAITQTDMSRRIPYRK